MSAGFTPATGSSSITISGSTINARAISRSCAGRRRGCLQSPPAMCSIPEALEQFGTSLAVLRLDAPPAAEKSPA